MSKMNVGFAGHRGMVGSVLMERMHVEHDFESLGIEPVFLSTSQAGQAGPVIDGKNYTLIDAYDLARLEELDAIVSCQGSEYTRRVHDDLRRRDWNGYWIDAASELRMKDSSVLILDPVNRSQIDEALNSGVKDLIGANCTVSILLMGLDGLFKQDLVEEAVLNTYQAVSGAGAKYIEEQLSQMRTLSNKMADILDDQSVSVLEKIGRVTEYLRSKDLPIEHFGYPIAANVLPWIGSAGEAAADGRTREEQKGTEETNKILVTDQLIPVTGICARVDSLRSHAQAVNLTLTQDLPLDEITSLITAANEWVKLVPNDREPTLSRLTPVATSGTLDIAVGRLYKSPYNSKRLNAYLVGDQLLWGAAEPLRRALKIVSDRPS